MSEDSIDQAFDALLAQELAVPERAPDRAFVARVDRAVAEAQRYRRWRTRLVRDLIGEGLTFAAMAGSFAMLSRAPGLSDALPDAPGMIWPLAFALLLVWMASRRGAAGLPV